VNGCYDALPVGVVAAPDAIERDAAALDRFVSAREASDLAQAAAFRAERHDIQREQVARLATQLPLPQIRLPFLYTPDITRTEIDVLADAIEHGVEAL
jgi:hypothetical protein